MKYPILFIVIAVFSYDAHAADVAKLPGDIVLTNEKGQCRLYDTQPYYIARGPRFKRGCWTMDKYTHNLTIRWPDGIQSFSEQWFEIYGELL